MGYSSMLCVRFSSHPELRFPQKYCYNSLTDHVISSRSKVIRSTNSIYLSLLVNDYVVRILFMGSWVSECRYIQESFLCLGD